MLMIKKIIKDVGYYTPLCSVIKLRTQKSILTQSVFTNEEVGEEIDIEREELS